jgi:hypothetical protein
MMARIEDVEDVEGVEDTEDTDEPRSPLDDLFKILNNDSFKTEDVLVNLFNMHQVGLYYSEFLTTLYKKAHRFVEDADQMIIFIKVLHQMFGQDIHMNDEYLFNCVLQRPPNYDLVALMLDLGCDFNLCYQIHSPSIIISLKTLELLLDHGCDLNFVFRDDQNHFIGIYDSTSNPTDEEIKCVLEKFIAAGYDIDSATLERMICDGYNQSAELLLNNGINIPDETETELFLYSIKRNNHSMVRLLLDKGIKLDWELIKQKQSVEKISTIAILQDYNFDLCDIVKIFTAANFI